MKSIINFVLMMFCFTSMAHSYAQSEMLEVEKIIPIISNFLLIGSEEEAHSDDDPLEPIVPPNVENLVNVLFDTPEKARNTLWDSVVRNAGGVDGLPPIVTRDRVDDASKLFFNDRTYLVAAARNYTVTGDIIWLDRAIAIANNYLNLRDDIYADRGGVVFTGNQTGYRSAIQPLLGSTTPAPVWSHDFVDKALVFGDVNRPAAEGRRVQVLQNGRVVSALAEVVLAYQTHKPMGAYIAPQGAQIGILEGSYFDIIQSLMVEINQTVRIFDGHWQQDLINFELSSDTNDGRWTVSGSYFYDKRQNLSSEGVDTDNIVPFNHAAGMLQARLVLARFSGLDPLAVEQFQRWAEHHESIYASDDPARANSGLSGNHFPYVAASQSYQWPYLSTQEYNEDIDHVIITLEVYMTAYRLSLIDRELIQNLFRAVESVYLDGQAAFYDRLYGDTSPNQQNNLFSSFRLLPGTINWLSIGTELQEKFVDQVAIARPSGGVSIRDYEPIIAYYGTEQLSRFSALP